jgi:hypothetical protein
MLRIMHLLRATSKNILVVGYPDNVRQEWPDFEKAFLDKMREFHEVSAAVQNSTHFAADAVIS